MVIRTRSNGGRGNRPHRKVRTHQQIFQEHLQRKVQDSSVGGTGTSKLTEVKVKKERVEDELSTKNRSKKTSVQDATEEDSDVSFDEIESVDSESYSSTGSSSDSNNEITDTEKAPVISTPSLRRTYGSRKEKNGKIYYKDIREFARKLVDNNNASPGETIDLEDQTKKDEGSGEQTDDRYFSDKAWVFDVTSVDEANTSDNENDISTNVRKNSHTVEDGNTSNEHSNDTNEDMEHR